MVHRGFPFESFSVASMGPPLLGLMIRWPTIGLRSLAFGLWHYRPSTLHQRHTKGQPYHPRPRHKEGLYQTKPKPHTTPAEVQRRPSPYQIKSNQTFHTTPTPHERTAIPPKAETQGGPVPNKTKTTYHTSRGTTKAIPIPNQKQPDLPHYTNATRKDSHTTQSRDTRRACTKQNQNHIPHQPPHHTPHTLHFT